jgi:hypothetical protein
MNKELDLTEMASNTVVINANGSSAVSARESAVKTGFAVGGLILAIKLALVAMFASQDATIEGLIHQCPP